MGNMGVPKPAGSRARRNKTSTNAILRAPSEGEITIPELPERDPEDGVWHFMTRAWWNDVWSSPMAPEFDDSDIHGLYMLAQLEDDFWKAKSPSLRRDVAAEIRLQAIRFGLSPIDRRRLQWEIEKTEEARDKGRRRRARAADGSGEPGEKPATGGDPRGILRSVPPIK